LIRCLLRAFTQEELTRDTRERLSLDEAREIMEGVTLDWNNREIEFEMFLRKKINGKASEILYALESCTCCDRHQIKRFNIDRSLFKDIV